MSLTALPFLGSRLPRRMLLELDLERGLVEHLPAAPVAHALHREAITLLDVVEALEQAARDERVRALLVRVGAGRMGMARIEELRDAVARFRAAGKPAVLFSESFGEFGPGHGGYYLATAFDQIWLQPSGAVGLTGIMAETPFVRDALDRLELEPQISQRHEYKSAANLFTENGFTDAHREEIQAVVDGLFHRLIETVARTRGLDPDRVRRLVDRGPLPADQAAEAGLVDRLGYRDELYTTLKARTDNATRVSARRYLRRGGRPFQKGEHTIAVIYGVGTVQRRTSRYHPLFGSVMGSDTVTTAFRRATEDEDTRAILFRVDSPGGSYVASDAVWRAVVRAREVGTPVIASMGNTAASGGYFVSMAADRILAHPSTLTGSIGVVAGKIASRGLWERLGIHWDEVHAGRHAGLWSPVRPYTPEERERLEAWLDRVYRDFTDKVGRARHLTHAQVDRIARGRVWTGVDALKIGLVDELGGFPLALRRAREAAGLAPDAPIRLRVFPRRKSLAQLLLQKLRKGKRPTATARAPLPAPLLPLADLARSLGLGPNPGVLRMPGPYLPRDD